jgi:hypothetical protein
MLRSLRTSSFLVLSAVAITGCGDGALFPRVVPGYYALASVNGRSLPYTSPPSYGFDAGFISRGDLLLRPDGTFIHGIGGDVLGGLYGGSYQHADRELVLGWRFPGALEDSRINGTIAGDSIVLDLGSFGTQSLLLTYRRAQQRPGPMPSNRYRLTSIDGRSGTPLVLRDTTINGTRYLGTVSDSVVFTDEVFFWRHRIEHFVSTAPGGEQAVSSDESIRWGAFERGPGWVRLFYYQPFIQGTSVRDSLAVAGDTLIRRTSLITGIREERYTSR